MSGSDRPADPTAAEREAVIAELRRVREEVRSRALLPRDAVLPPPRPVAGAAAPPPIELPAEAETPRPPDNAALNALWQLPRPGGAGPKGVLARLVARLLAPVIDAQTAFNSRQVQLDNELLGWIEARFAATHRHYDAVLGAHGRHMGEIDERHLILQEELVAHVHDLVARIDLVLAESERGRLSLEHALREVKGRLQRLEERLAAR